MIRSEPTRSGFGLVDDSTYRGLALDNNVIILALLFLFQHAVSATAFAIVLYAALIALAALNVASIRTPKFGGSWYYVVTLYALCLSAIYGWQLLYG